MRLGTHRPTGLHFYSASAMDGSYQIWINLSGNSYTGIDFKNRKSLSDFLRKMATKIERLKMTPEEFYLPEDATQQQYEAEVKQWWRDPEYEAFLDKLEAEQTKGELMDFMTEDVALAQLLLVRTRLVRLCNLMSVAETAKTKEEALMFMDELSKADEEVAEAFGDRFDKNIPEWIREGKGDYKKLQSLYTSLGAV
jgi:hypothetical protein